MRRNLALVAAIVIGLLLAYNSSKKIISFRGTSQKVDQAQAKLDNLKLENERLKQELEYKKSDKFAEEEIRNKLGLVKPGEDVYAVPKGDNSQSSIVDSHDEKPNWQKWRDFLFGGG